MNTLKGQGLTRMFQEGFMVSGNFVYSRTYLEPCDMFQHICWLAYVNAAANLFPVAWGFPSTTECFRHQ